MSNQPPNPPPPPPPPGGGASPPPGGGAPPPPPPGGGAAPQPGGAGPPSTFDVGQAFSYGWSKFQANAGPIVLGTLALLAIYLVITIIWFFVVAAAAGASDGFIGTLIAAGLAGLVVTLLGYVVQAGLIRGGLALTRGQSLEVSTVLATDHFGQILLTALIIGVASGIGFLLCYIPGLVVLFFAMFAMYFVIDQRLSAVEAIRASVDLVNRNLGQMVALFVLSGIALFVGQLLCYVGLLLAFPVVVITQAYAYRTLRGEAVAPT